MILHTLGAIFPAFQALCPDFQIFCEHFHRSCLDFRQIKTFGCALAPPASYTSASSPSVILVGARDDRCAMVLVVLCISGMITARIIALDKPFTPFT